MVRLIAHGFLKDFKDEGMVVCSLKRTKRDAFRAICTVTLTVCILKSLASVVVGVIAVLPQRLEGVLLEVDGIYFSLVDGFLLKDLSRKVVDSSKGRGIIVLLRLRPVGIRVINSNLVGIVSQLLS